MRSISTTPFSLIAGALRLICPWTMTAHTGDMKGAGTDRRFSVEYATRPGTPNPLCVQACAEFDQSVQQQKSQFLL
jgi:hypothetical protein